jgi:hypothetical protein
VLTVVTWLWSAAARDFKARHVDVLARMFRRKCTVPHRVVCITDRPAHEFDRSIVEVVPTPPAARALERIRTPEGRGFPSCYRRLWLFSPEARELGDRFLQIDLDVVLTGNVDHIAGRDESFVGWVPNEGVWHGRDRYGGGLYLLRAGPHPEVWADFDGQRAIDRARRAGYRGSDQAWLNFKLYGRTSRLPDDAGILMFRDLKPAPHVLPEGVRMVQFSGHKKPWGHLHLPWVAAYWR